MNLSFDYYHNLEDTEIYLCNPDGKELYSIVGFDRNLTLRFNDLSELTFSCYATTTKVDGTTQRADAYDYLQTRRLVFATNIGWFVIYNVKEEDNGTTKYKTVSCYSLQSTFKDKGVYSEERVYVFYNTEDPTDAQYDANNPEHTPSVVGQLYQQLGIQCDLSQGLDEPSDPYDEWTITYINDAIKGSARSFKSGTNYGYEWMVKDVESAFETIVFFDFYYKTIHVLLPSEVTQAADVLYSFSNFMQNVEVSEDASNIVTVMNCNGNNCDITNVNPTGTNYICDFSYYMDVEGKWMSSALKTKLNEWQSDVEEAKPEYESNVTQLRDLYTNLTAINAKLQDVSKIYTDLEIAGAKYSASEADPSSQSSSGIVWCETVNMGETSIDDDSVPYHGIPFDDRYNIVAYRLPPTYNATTDVWTFSGDYYAGTPSACFNYVDSQNRRYLYFSDAEEPSVSAHTYCVLQGRAKLNTEDIDAQYICSGFKRYTDISHANNWAEKYDTIKTGLQTQKSTYESAIANKKTDLRNISEPINIINYFSSTPALLKELYCYWIEGDYTNENIAVYDNTTLDEEIAIENELLASAKIELAKVCRPNISFSVSSAYCLNQYEFRDQMRALELGRIVTVEKEDGLWYYPALIEMSYSLDAATFQLTFANSLRLDDWGYTYGDLISNATTTSRAVSANWQNLMEYSKQKESIIPLIRDPLSATLRSGFANMTNQEFISDNTGILGRKLHTTTSSSDAVVFDPEQMRITNNLILFTDDGWDTVKSALGKITYTEGTSQRTAYGLIADTIIGDLLIGNRLKIHNSNNSISIDGNGISITNATSQTTVFHADNSGSLTLTGTVYASSGRIGGDSGFIIDENSLHHATSSGDIDIFLCTGSTNEYTIAGYTADGWVLKAGNAFGVLDDGRLYCSAGTFKAGCVIGDQLEIRATRGTTVLCSRYMTLPDDFYELPSGETKGFFLDAGYDANWGGIQARSEYVTCGMRSEGITLVSNYAPPEYLVTALTSEGYFGFAINDTSTHTVTDIGWISPEWGSVIKAIDMYGEYRMGFSPITSGGNYSLRAKAANSSTGAAGGGELKGTWTGTVSAGSESDRNIKHDIEDMPERYDALFDNLHPLRFKYNNGTSDRYHTGFIAQEVKQAIEDSGLTTKDFAAYYTFENQISATESIQTAAIRYGEFVSLNTWQIQKLKARVAELEAVVAALHNKE